MKNLRKLALGILTLVVLFGVMASSVMAAGGAVALTPPAAPSGLTAVATSGTSVLLNWIDNSNNETSFQVNRGANAAAVANKVKGSVALPANTITFVDSTVAPGVTYFYAVQAVNAAGDSTSNIVSVTTPGVNTAGVAAADFGNFNVDEDDNPFFFRRFFFNPFFVFGETAIIIILIVLLLRKGKGKSKSS